MEPTEDHPLKDDPSSSDSSVLGIDIEITEAPTIVTVPRKDVRTFVRFVATRKDFDWRRCMRALLIVWEMKGRVGRQPVDPHPEYKGNEQRLLYFAQMLDWMCDLPPDMLDDAMNAAGCIASWKDFPAYEGRLTERVFSMLRREFSFRPNMAYGVLMDVLLHSVWLGDETKKVVKTSNTMAASSTCGTIQQAMVLFDACLNYNDESELLVSLQALEPPLDGLQYLDPGVWYMNTTPECDLL